MGKHRWTNKRNKYGIKDLWLNLNLPTDYVTMAIGLSFLICKMGLITHASCGS